MEQLKCPICKNEYSESNPPRLLTMCGHTFCHNCIKNLIKRKDYRYVVRCPEDRLTIYIDINSPSHFPKNIALLQAYRRNHQKEKEEGTHGTNEFLTNTVGSQKKSGWLKQSRRSLSDLKQGFLGPRKTSIQQGICLLHLKPLDIVCMQQKIHICAECALFGLHKGHNFTTYKEITEKNKSWSHHIGEIIEQKMHIDTKILNGEIEKELSCILNKKKDILNEEIERYLKRVKDQIYYYEETIKKELQEKMEKLEGELKSIMTIDPRIEQDFNAWTSKAEGKIHQLQQENMDNIVILDQSDERLCSEGKNMLERIKNELIRFWSKIQSALQYPKITYSLQIQKELNNLITFQIYEQPSPKSSEYLIMQQTKPDDYSTIQGRKEHHILNEVSLLDISAGFRFDMQEQPTVNFSQISFINEPLEIQTYQNLQQSEILSPKSVKKGKRELNLNMSLVNSVERKSSHKSPKVKTQLFTKKSFNTPVTTPKARLRKFIFNAKQPQKFEKIISGLDTDSINNIDLTGFQIGDSATKQLCLRIIDCKRPKLLRLMKNNLSDECAKEVVESLKVIDYLNLAQNNFTQKILDILLDYCRRGQINKGKTIQLGQNHLNSRKFKEKLDELKKVGVMITL